MKKICLTRIVFNYQVYIYCKLILINLITDKKDKLKLHLFQLY